MSYYILPKINNDSAITNIIKTFKQKLETVKIEEKGETIKKDVKQEPFVSHSLIFYLQDVKIQLNKMNQNNMEDPTYSLEQLIKIINPYEFIFTKLPNSKFSVSKLKPFSSLFFDLLEIIHTLNLFDSLNESNIKTLHFGKNVSSSIECINMLRENHSDLHVTFDNYDEPFHIFQTKYDFLYFEMSETDNMNLHNYTLWFLKTFIYTLLLQIKGGIVIIKIHDIYSKTILDILFLLCNFYEKIYLIKPNSSNIITSEKYIVCKKLIDCDDSILLEITKIMQEIVHLIEESNDKEYCSIFSYFIYPEIPTFFINKLEEFNIITGQQQLNAINQIMNLMKTKNKDDKIENYKKLNIQKCISWCEKYKIPCNKFNEKNNIFLPLIKIEKEEVILEEDETEILSSPL